MRCRVVQNDSGVRYIVSLARRVLGGSIWEVNVVVRYGSRMYVIEVLNAR